MIYAVSNLKLNGLKTGTVSYQNNGNIMSRNNINSQSADTFTKNISFRGANPLGLIAVTAGKIARDLPLVKKPLIAAASDLIHELGDTGVTVTIPLPDVNVAKPVIAGARDIIVPHVQDLAGEAAKEGASAAGHEVAGAIAEGTSGALQEHGDSLLEGLKNVVHEVISSIK